MVIALLCGPKIFVWQIIEEPLKWNPNISKQLLYSTLILLAIVLCQEVNSQSDSKFDFVGLSFQGKVINALDSSALHNVHIYSLNSDHGTLTDVNGHFVLKHIKKNELIQISTVGYRSEVFSAEHLAAGGFKIIPLNPKTYELDEVRVLPFSKHEFKRDFLSLEIPDTARQINWNLPFPRKPKDEYEPYEISSRIALNSPITFIYNLFSKDAKMYRRSIAYQKVTEKQKQLALKFNEKIMTELTDLEENEAQEFITFCDLSDEFIENSEEYDLRLAIVSCYKEWKERK